VKPGNVYKITRGKFAGQECRIVTRRRKGFYPSIWADRLQQRVNVSLVVTFDVRGEVVEQRIDGTIHKDGLIFVREVDRSSAPGYNRPTKTQQLLSIIRKHARGNQ
jgi:hypothetical protein